MVDTVANLGFAVDSKPLDDAKTKLAGVETQAKATGRAVDDFNQKASKTGANLGAGPKQLAVGLSEAEQAAAKAGTSLGVLDSMAKRSGVSIAEMATRVAAARAGMTATAVTSAELGTALNVVAPAASAAAVSVASKASAMRQLNQAMRTASPLLNEFSGGLGHVLTSSTRVRGSIGVLAAVVGTELAIAFAKAGDQVLRSQKLFDAMTGSTTSGKAALDKVKETAKASGVDFDTMAQAIQKAAQGQAVFADKNVIYANTADRAERNIKKLADGFGTIGRILQSVGATGKEESAVFAALGESIQKTGGLTDDAFQKIRDTSLPTARAIASAFGFKDIEEFQRQLEKTPITLDQLLDRLMLVKPAADAAGSGVKTFEQATREMGVEWRHLLETLANNGAFSVVANSISALSKLIAAAARNTSSLSAALAAIPGANAIMAGNKLGNFIKDNIQASGGGGVDEGGFNSAFNPGGFDNSGSASFDESGFEGFASGGSFVVGGDGGTDTTNVAFRATKGEIVTIATPDQAASGIASLTAVSGTTDIEDLLKEQTRAIVDAINGLKTPSTNTATAAVAAVSAVGGSSSGGGTSAFGAGGSAGGGSGGASNPFKKLEDEQKKHEQELATRERELGGGGNFAGGSPLGLIGGQAVAIRGFGGGGTFPTRTPTGEFTTFGTGRDENGIIKVPQVEKNTGETNRRLNEANQSLDDVGRATASTTRGVESGARDTVEAIGASSNTIASAISSALSSMGQSLMDQGGGSSGGGGFGGGGGGGSSDYSGGGGFVDSFGLPGGGGGFGGFNGSSSFDESGFSGGGLDFSGSSSFDESGFAGSFAKGGSFIAGGDGGTDTTPVKFFATKGERITITPPGMRVSPSMLHPGSGGGSPSRPVQHVTNKKVTINVQAGISADTILRSRAQIQRAM